MKRKGLEISVQRLRNTTEITWQDSLRAAEFQTLNLKEHNYVVEVYYFH